MRQIQVGVIGTGGMGERHVNNLTNEVATAQVVAVMGVDVSMLVADACVESATSAKG